MPKMSELELRDLLTAQRWDSMSAITASKLSEERATSLDYYQGDMSKYMPAPAGRSKAVSMDTSDTIEGMMPTLMDIFAGGDEVVRFDPIGPQDVAAAEQETDYVNHVFMQSNQGFLILYAFIKDALLSKNGIVKIYWEKEELKERETYLDQPPEALAALLQSPDVEVVEHTEHDGLHDVTIEAARVSEKARVVSVPPEEFGISRHARQIKDATYCFHDVFRTESQLIEQGFDEGQVKKLPSYLVAHTVEEIARDTVNESTLRQGEDNLNTANRLIRVTEHYIKLDYEKNDDPRLYRVTTAGEEGHVLLRDGEPDVIEEDRIPFAAMTPVIITHRFFAETGIKDLFMLLHATIRKHASKPAIAKLRGQWAQVDPRDWKTRDDMTINVGLGTGSKSEQLAHLQLIIAVQKEAVLGGLPIVSAQNIFNAAKELTKLAGHKDTDKFFTAPGQPADPSNPASAPLQKPPDPKQQEIAAKAQAEQAKVQADAAHQQMKTQADIQFQTQKAQVDSQLAQSKAQLEAELARQKFALELRLKEIDAQLREQELRHREAHHAMTIEQLAASHAAQMEQAKMANSNHNAN